MLLYSSVRILHILAITIWVLGLLLLSSANGFASANRQPGSLAGLVRWNHRLVLPAMVLTWVFGLAMAMMVGWLGQPWLDIKMGLVAVLTALQLWQTRVLGRLARDVDYRPPGWMGLSGALAFLLAVMVIMLAVVKPFF